jgi:phosphoribosylglycinamide formyltransferase 1
VTSGTYPRPDQLPDTPRTLRLVVLISGGGSTMANLADRTQTGGLDASIELVVSSQDRVAGLDQAQRRRVPAIVLPRRAFVKDGVFDRESYTEVLIRMITPVAPDLIVLGGFMSQLAPALFERYAVVNIHPALLPRHGGKGMYGRRVHEAVLAAGECETGCTVHFVDPEYDHGPILAQLRVPVLQDDTPETLAERVQAAERELYPEAIGLIGAGRVHVRGTEVVIL